MKKWLFACLIALSLQANAWDDSPECFKRFEQDFFKERYLDEAFSLYQVTVPQGSWNIIFRALQAQMQQVPALVKKQANLMAVNPLEHPFQAEQAEKLLFDVLFAAFAQVMHDYNVADDYNIRDMFNYILEKQQAEIDSCFKTTQQKPAVKKHR